MTRVDVPTLQCDRCKLTTQDRDEMWKFKKINWYVDSMGSKEIKKVNWYVDSMERKEIKKDLCPTCFENFQEFMKNKPVKGLVRLK